MLPVRHTHYFNPTVHFPAVDLCGRFMASASLCLSVRAVCVCGLRWALWVGARLVHTQKAPECPSQQVVTSHFLWPACNKSTTVLISLLSSPFDLFLSLHTAQRFSLDSHEPSLTRKCVCVCVCVCVCRCCVIFSFGPRGMPEKRGWAGHHRRR